MNNFKSNLIDNIEMISNPKRQEEYYESVSIADVPSELISGWFDDGFYVDDEDFRKEFSDEEWLVLCEFNDFFESRLTKLPDNFSELANNYFWKEIVGKANWVLDVLKWRNVL